MKRAIRIDHQCHALTHTLTHSHSCGFPYRDRHVHLVSLFLVNITFFPPFQQYPSVHILVHDGQDVLSPTDAALELIIIYNLRVKRKVEIGGLNVNWKGKEYLVVVLVHLYSIVMSEMMIRLIMSNRDSCTEIWLGSY